MFNTIILHRPLPYEAPGNVMLSDLSPTTNKEREIYENIEADHEYEILDKYNQATANYEDVKFPPPAKPQPTEAEAVQLQPMASTGDYEFSQCPAYVPMATTSIHGNTTRLLQLSQLLYKMIKKMQMSVIDYCSTSTSII